MNIVAGSTMSAMRAVSVRNCSCTHDEQVLARKAAPHLFLIGRDHQRVGVLDQHGLDRAAAGQRLALAGQHGADAALVQPAHADVARVEPFDQCLVRACRRRCWRGSAPPPSCAQAPVTAGMHSAACMFAAPLRWREKP